jgi:hypothetical protein
MMVHPEVPWSTPNAPLASLHALLDAISIGGWWDRVPVIPHAWYQARHGETTMQTAYNLSVENGDIRLTLIIPKSGMKMKELNELIRQFLDDLDRV